MKIGDRISRIIADTQYDTTQFAKKIGVSPKAVSNVISGEKQPTFRFVENLCRVFPISSKYIITGKGDPYTDDINKYIYSNENKPSGIHKDAIERFKQVRISLDMSQAIFAHELGVTRDSIASIENGRQMITISLLYQLYEKYKISADYILFGQKKGGN